MFHLQNIIGTFATYTFSKIHKFYETIFYVFFVHTFDIEDSKLQMLKTKQL